MLCAFTLFILSIELAACIPNVPEYANLLSLQPVRLAFTAPQTISYEVYSSSNVVAATNVSLLFVVDTQLGVSTGGSIVIVLNQISSAVGSTSCRLTAANTSILYPCSIVNNASDSEVVIANISSLLATSFNITVANTFTNPASTYPQAYFTFITYSELNTEIERSPSFPTTYLTITQPAAFISFTVTRTSARNSDKANYTLAFNQPSLFQTTAVNTLTLGFPPEVDLSSASCANCTVSSSSSRITVMLDNSILTNSTSFNLTVLDVVNAPSFQPPSSNFSATTVINANYYYSSASAPDNYLQTINSQPADILLTNATAFSNFKVAQADSLTVVISNSNNVYYYFLALNPQLIVQNITCSVPSNFSWAFNPALHSLTLNRTNPAIAFPSSFTFVVAGFTNPVISST
jgi:hypothetical protein